MTKERLIRPSCWGLAETCCYPEPRGPVGPGRTDVGEGRAGRKPAAAIRRGTGAAACTRSGRSPARRGTPRVSTTTLIVTKNHCRAIADAASPSAGAYDGRRLLRPLADRQPNGRPHAPCRYHGAREPPALPPDRGGRRKPRDRPGSTRSRRSTSRSSARALPSCRGPPSSFVKEPY